MRARILALTMLSSLGCTQSKDSGIRGSAEAAIQRSQTKAAQERTRVAQNSALLAELGTFGPSPSDRDGGAVLNDLVPYSPAGTSTPALALPAKLLEQLRREDWLTSPEIASDNLDYRWLTELGGYDHWNLWNAPRVKGTGPYGFTEATLPNFLVFPSWAKLRLREGQRRGELEVARAEIRHLARILASTELMIGVVVAAKLVDLVDRKDTTTPIVREQILSLEQQASLTAEPKLLEGFLSKLDAPVACAAANESLWISYMLRPLVESRFLASYKIMDQAIQQKGPCRWEPLRTAWAERATKGRFVDNFAALPSNPALLRAARQQVLELSHDPRAADAGPEELGLLLLVAPMQEAAH